MPTVDLDSFLELDWDEFVHTLHLQLSWWQLQWPDTRISLDVSRDGSWLDTLARFRACAGYPLRRMEYDDRQVLLGNYTPDQNTCFFGELRSAGHVTTVLQNPKDHRLIVAALDKARTMARALGVRPSLTNVMRPWNLIDELEGFGPAAASRLLMSERPDLYIMLNTASRSGLQALTGVRLPQQIAVPTIGTHYENLLERIYGAPWWQEPRPEGNLLEAFIWEGRAALVDVFAYDGDGTRFP